LSTALALPTAGLSATEYAAPAVAFRGETAQQEDAVWWVVVVGFAYAIALAYVAWCRRNGGNGEITFGWSGFKVVCRSK
jgi:hypothetical protein